MGGGGENKKEKNKYYHRNNVWEDNLKERTEENIGYEKILDEKTQRYTD